MHKLTAEQLAQRMLDAGLLDARQIESLWAELGTREVTFDAMSSLLLRKELLTNFQLDRLIKGERAGYFYGANKVLYLVGTGTFARVYRAVNMETGRIVAVKALRKRFREDKGVTEQFVREGKIGMKLRHPCIVPIYEVLEHPSPALVMEFIEGSNLREFFRVRKKLSPIEGMRVAVDILAGLDHAFHQGMTHRDLKMSNVLISGRGRCKLVDFGLAGLQSGGGRDVEETNPRTIDYAALERASGVRNNDPRSDLYFVGVILYNLLTGVSPIGEAKDRLARLASGRFQNIKPITGHDPTIPGRLAAFVMQSLELNPEKRYASAQEMYSDAKRILARLEAGDLGDADMHDSHGAMAAVRAVEQLPVDQEGLHKSVMIVEAKTEMQDLLRERLKKYGYRVLVYSDPERAIKRFVADPERPPADCAVFCAQYLGPAALQGFNEFGAAEETKEIPAVLFADAKQTNLIKSAHLAPHRLLLTAPLKVRELRETLVKLLRPA
jgi:serine/threonine-protein kinase